MKTQKTTKHFCELVVVACACLFACVGSVIASPIRVRIGPLPEDKTIGIRVTVKDTNTGDTTGGGLKVAGNTGGTSSADMAAALALQLNNTPGAGVTAEVDPNDSEKVIIKSKPGYSQPMLAVSGKELSDPPPTTVDIKAAAIIPNGVPEVGYARLRPIDIADTALGGQVSFGVESFVATVTTTPNESYQDLFTNLATGLVGAGLDVELGPSNLTIFSMEEFFFSKDDAGLYFRFVAGTIPEPSTWVLALGGFVVLIGSRVRKTRQNAKPGQDGRAVC